MAGDNATAVAALVVALVALLTTTGQVLQQYFGTADGFRRCQDSVVGPWAKRTRLRFRWSEFRFETLFTVPFIMLQRTVWVSSEMPESPYVDGGWIVGRPDHCKGADEANLLISGRAADTPELVTWLRFLRAIQWTHKTMLLKLSRVAQAENEKNDLQLAADENRNLTMPVVKFEERSWDFMPPDVVKPYARINIGDLGVVARRLGMEWDRFEPADGILRAQGNGYNLTSMLVRSVGTMVEINEVMGSGGQYAPLPWLTPVIPEHVERKMLLIPCAAADKMAFGILPGVGSDFLHRDFDVSSLESIPGLLRYFTKNEGLVAAFASGQWQQIGWCPGVSDLLSIIAPMMYRPELGMLGVPAPDNGILFHGVTAASAAFVEFRNCLQDLLQQTDASSMSNLVWVYEKISSLSAASNEWTHEIDLLARYWADVASQSFGTPPQLEIYQAYRKSTAMIEAIPIRGNAEESPSSSSYISMIAYHLRHMFDHQNIGSQQAIYYGHRNYPYPLSLTNEGLHLRSFVEGVGELNSLDFSESTYSIMFSQLSRHFAFGRQALTPLGRHAVPRRSMATVGETTLRQLRARNRTRAPLVSHDRATFTIRDGPVFHGKSFGAKSNISGEAVFTTSLVGYPESLTDPSYRGQILVFTQPLIGNYGVPASVRDDNGLLRYFESPNIQAVGVVVADVAEQYSHWTAVESLCDWCAREGVPAITGVDTRAIVTHLREQGSSLARITIGEEYDADQDEAFVDPEQINLVRKVSTKAPFHVSAANPLAHVAVIDCGVKENILRSLVGRGASVTAFPFDYPIHKVAHHFDGIFISNGPGDPTHCQDTVYHLRKLMETSQIPIFGICLGHQLLALAAGARTVKLKYGNRAHNIPALDLTTGRCHITSQNHGYAVDAATLPSDWKPYFLNLNDNSNEGLIHASRPIFSTQFHPEAKGGPLDSAYLFDMYLENVLRYKKSQAATQPQRDSRPSPLLVDLLAKERVGVQPTIGMANMLQAQQQQQPVYAAGAA